MSIGVPQLVELLARLPGLGPRSARRIVFHLLKRRESLMRPLAGALTAGVESIASCRSCGNLDLCNPCSLCSAADRDRSQICVVEQPADLWAFERGGVYKGLYFVLGGALSALDGVGPEDLGLPRLLERARQPQVEEIILATNATVDGQTTAHYIAASLKGLGIRISRLACGLPLGGELDYLDDGTLAAAFKARQAQ